MLPEAWKQLRPHPIQNQLYRTKARFVAVAAGRGSGKTELARRRVVRYLPVRKPWKNPLYFYALPTLPQAKKVAWKPLKALVPPEWVANINETELYIETVFGSTLLVMGLDRPQRAEGVQYDGGVIDESCDQRPDVFDKSLLPAFSERRAWCWRIGVPKRQGVGASEFRSVCEDYLKSDDPSTASFAWPSSDILTPEEIEWAMNNLDPRDFDEQYRANWQNSSGGIFHEFDREENVTPNAEYDPNRVICVGSDFNVDPMCWVLGHQSENGVEVFAELFIRNTNTRQSLDTLYKRFHSHTSGWEFYGDATGQSRKTSASETDYIQIRNDKRFSPKRVYYPSKNPGIANRFAATNALLRNAKGERRLLIHPRCEKLIWDLESRVYKPGVREPDDYGDIGHITDALGYWVYLRFPVKLESSSHAEVSIGKGVW